MIKRFIKYYKPYKRLFFTDMLCAGAVSCVDLATPLIISRAINFVFRLSPASAVLGAVLPICAAMFGMYLLKALCEYYITSKGHIMGAHMETDMRFDLFKHLEKLSFSYYDKNNTGVMMSRIVSDLFDIAELAHHGPEDIFISLLKLVGAFVILFSLNMKITLVLLAVTVTMLATTIYYNRKMRAVFTDNRRKMGDVNAILQDSLSGIRVVKSFANEHIELEKFSKGNTLFFESRKSSYLMMGKYFSMNGFFQGLMYLSVILTGAAEISKGTLDPSSMIVYVLYINMYLEPIKKLVNFTEQFQKGFSGFRRMTEILDTAPDVTDRPGAAELKNPSGRITFENVSFSYGKSERVLENINLDILPGKTIAVVGPSGVGKTTFCSLIPRFYDVTTGVVKIDGADVRDIKLAALRSQIGIVQQDVYIFNSTVRENISYGDPRASLEEIVEAAKKANIHNFIMTLEDGYDTIVGERGARFSGGQKQRLSIARVFLKNPPILILDEATSSLDNESEKYIKQSLELLSESRTTIVIAHRLGTIKNADEIIVFSDGGISERGRHEGLLKQNGEYAYLYGMAE